MKRLRRLRLHPVIHLVLGLSLALRVLVAPGFMILPDEEGPLGFTFSLCEGMGGIDTIESMDGLSDHHRFHDPAMMDAAMIDAMVESSDDAPMSNQVEPPCAVWSTSSASMAIMLVVLASTSDYPQTISVSHPDTDQQRLETPFYQSRHPRAPPATA